MTDVKKSSTLHCRGKNMVVLRSEDNYISQTTQKIKKMIHFVPSMFLGKAQHYAHIRPRTQNVTNFGTPKKI